MRSHRAILRKIAESNLDPKVPYVSDGKGGIIAKFTTESKVENIEYILGERLETQDQEKNVIEVITEQKEEILDTAEDTKEVIESKEEVSEKKEDTEPVEDNTVKKKFPFQKKKVVPTEQNS